MYIIAVTGITGKSGQYFLKTLLKEKDKLKNYKFILLCRNNKILSPNSEEYELVKRALKDESLQMEIYDVDLRETEHLKNFFENNDINIMFSL